MMSVSSMRVVVEKLDAAVGQKIVKTKRIQILKTLLDLAKEKKKIKKLITYLSNNSSHIVSYQSR